jgi:hypothetical protein
LLGKTWIEKDQIRRKIEEGAIEKKNQELRDFISTKSDRLIEEREVKSKQQKARELFVEVETTQEGLKDLSMQEESNSTQEVVRERVLTLNPLEVHHHCEVTTIGETKNKNGKRNPETVRET